MIYIHDDHMMNYLSERKSHDELYCFVKTWMTYIELSNGPSRDHWRVHTDSFFLWAKLDGP
ncbi:unnamed protein product [Arabidopsis halleri]